MPTHDAARIRHSTFGIRHSAFAGGMVQRFGGLVLLSGAMLASSLLLAQAFAQTPASPEIAANAPLPAATNLSHDLESIDAFIWEVISSLDANRYREATQAYYELLSHAGNELSSDDAAVLDRHLRTLAMIMPAADRERIGLNEPDAEELARFLPPGAGEQLVQWWRIHDTLPATDENERLQEHLTRVVYATTQFPNAHDIRGFDDRGEVYIRLGAPSHQTNVEFKTPSLLIDPVGMKLPRNAFWVYRHVGYDAHYLFVEHKRSTGFELGEPIDLIPRNLRASRRYTATLLEWMEEVYGQLALYHNVYGLRYDEVVNYRALPASSEGPPETFARSLLMRSKAEDMQLAWQRQQTVPASYSNTAGLAEPLIVQMRWARFLDADRTTRTEIYWAIEPDRLPPSRRLRRALYKQGHEPSNDYLISASFVHRNARHQNTAIAQKHYLVDTELQGDLPPRTLTLKGDTATFNVALQWDERWTLPGASDTSLQPGARLKLGTYRIDTLEALYGGDAHLEMSDIKPLLMAENQTPQSAAPYPYPLLEAETPLALYFEVYNLAFGSDDRTAFSVTYEVVRRGERGLFNPADDSRTRARSSYTGDSRTAREYIIPDLQHENVRGDVEIVLYVTDDITGETINRSVSFDYR